MVAHGPSIAYDSSAAIRLGGMAPAQELFGPGNATALVRPDGRPTPEFRAELRQVSNVKNALSIVLLYAQTIAIIVVAVNLGWWAWPIAFILMGRAHAQFAAMMHEAAHRLLFTNKKWNDAVGRWAWATSGSSPPMPIAGCTWRTIVVSSDLKSLTCRSTRGTGLKKSMRRKLIRDATGQTGFRLLKSQFAPGRWKNPRQRKVLTSMLAVHSVLFAASILTGQPLVYPLLWILPFLTLWRVINRLRSIAEHGGLAASSDRRSPRTACAWIPSPVSSWRHTNSAITLPITSTRGAIPSLPKYHRASKSRATSLTPTSTGHTRRCGRRCRRLRPLPH